MSGRGRPQHVVVVGAGMGGLAIAARLAHRGLNVTVFDQQPVVGGRNRRQKVGECWFDSGPTLLMMLDPFRKLFQELGEDFDRDFSPKVCDPCYRVFFADGTRIDATTDRTAMTERLRQLAGDRDAAAFRPFLERLEKLYDEAIPNFVRKNYRTLADFAAPAQVARVLRHGMLGNLARRIERTFQDPRLRMLFSFQTMYLGLSPYDAPWVYSTLAYMEYGEGISYPKGGLSQIADRIAELGCARSVRFRLGERVAKIRTEGVDLASGEFVPADLIVSNADLPVSQKEIEGKPGRNLRNSCSAHLIYIDYDGDLPGLEHHNVFFGNDFSGNLNALFHELNVPDDPAFYVCCSAKSDPAMAPAGHTNVMILVPVPNLERPIQEGELESLEAQVFAKLQREVGFDSRKIRAIDRRGPKEWESELGLWQGAAFGIRADIRQSAFMRPQNRSKHQSNLYYVGASTVPGNGLPMVLISAELAEQRMLEDGVFSA